MGESSVNVVYGILLVLCCISYVSAQNINTTHGEITGLRTLVLGKPVDVYYGIPFAKPPIGKLRFKHPESADHWRPEVKDTRAKTPSCPQNPGITMGMSWRAVPSLMSEDCLHINVWVPVNVAPNTKLSTMVWIYGGSFNTGSINMPLYNGQNLAAEQNVIVMSINYRLGALGFLYTGPGTFPGNQGMMDQVLGMKWIYNNVERFGGDQKSITLFGESAGAVAVSHHLLSPLSRDYYTRAIFASGASNSIWAYGSTSFAKDNARTLAKGCGCVGQSDAEIYDCMKDMPSGTILEKQNFIVTTGVIAFGPVVDGYFLPDTPEELLRKGQIKNTDILLGANKDEGNLFLLATLPTIYRPQDDISVSKTDFQMFPTMFTVGLGKPYLAKAVSAQYVDTHVSSSRNYAEIADDILGDSYFKCPIVSLANTFDRKNSVYLYSFEHKLSYINSFKWIGAAHGYELELVFGHPLGPTARGTGLEQILTRQMMQYWTQFAKTGNPNLPNQPMVMWPEYDQTDEKYLVLDLPAKMTTRRGLRKQQCVFWNSLVPIISESTCTKKTTTENPLGMCYNSADGMMAATVPVFFSTVSAVVIVLANTFL